jgi:hypothetical protein
VQLYLLIGYIKSSVKVNFMQKCNLKWCKSFYLIVYNSRMCGKKCFFCEYQDLSSVRNMRSLSFTGRQERRFTARFSDIQNTSNFCSKIFRHGKQNSYFPKSEEKKLTITYSQFNHSHNIIFLFVKRLLFIQNTVYLYTRFDIPN